MTPENQQILNVQLVKVCLANHQTTSTLLTALVEYMSDPKQTTDFSLSLGRASEALEKSAGALNECITQLEKGSK